MNRRSPNSGCAIIPFTMAAVPSGDPSSMIRMWKHLSSPKTARMIFSMFSFSLYVGMMTILSLLCIDMYYFLAKVVLLRESRMYFNFL